MLVFAATLLLTAAALPSPFLLGADAATGRGPTGLLPAENCTTMCGDVVVPYPFGTTVGCYLPGFNLTCDTSQEPPLLYLGNGTLLVVNISLEHSTVRVVGPDIDMVESISTDYAAIGTWGGQGWGLSDEGPYILSQEYNELVLSGCGLSVELLIPDPQVDQVINTCGAMCSPSSRDNECREQPKSPRCGKCSGLGCCQVPVAVGRVAYKARLIKTLHDPIVITNYSVFISEEGWFQPYNSSRSAIPVMLAWAIVSNVLSHVSDGSRDGNATCPKDLGSTACHSNYSTCRNTGRLYGNNGTPSYTCSCWDGYQGNPYLPHGCQGT
nr:unnamed protein product [Digitaria exilis]